MTSNDEPLLYTVEEAAKRLGIGRALAYEAARSGGIPAIRIGRWLLVPKEALDRFLAGASREVTS
jgi:excisionase family DNA binding protein